MLYFKTFALIVCEIILSVTIGGVQSRVANDEIRQDCLQNEYIQNGTSCYKHHDTPMTWYDAASTCEAEGAHLVIVNDNTEAVIISDLIKDSSTNFDWVGIRDITGNNYWFSVQGDSVGDIYNVWAAPTRKFKCGGWRFGKLDDVPCKNSYSFLCEK